MMSYQACQNAAREFEGLFYATGRRWVVVGATRRLVESDHVQHLCIPNAAKGNAINAVWERANDLLRLRKLDLWEYEAGETRPPGSEYRMCGLALKGIRHEIYLATMESFFPRMVEWTGPAGYWRMLQWRLELDGGLKMHRGCVCVIDRSTEPNRLEAIPCADEHVFYKLARTPYKPPHERFARPPGQTDDTENWPRGMLPPWYPDGVKVFANPRQTYFWDNSRPATHVGQDKRAWRHR